MKVRDLYEARLRADISKPKSASMDMSSSVQISIVLSLKQMGRLLKKQPVILDIPDVNRDDNKYTVMIRYGGKAVAEN